MYNSVKDMKTHYIISFDLNVPIIMEQVLEFCKQFRLVIVHTCRFGRRVGSYFRAVMAITNNCILNVGTIAT